MSVTYFLQNLIQIYFKRHSSKSVKRSVTLDNGKYSFSNRVISEYLVECTK